MTRPIGKSPARTKSVRSSSSFRLDEVSLIDVVAEDDNLLATKGSFGSRSRPAASPFKVSGPKQLESIQEDQLQDAVVNEEIKEDFPSTCLQGPTPSKKKKKNGFNLRKSLAWNNAFFTEEGVLDPEELALVNQTFKKPSTIPKQGSHKKPAVASKPMNSSGISKLNFSPMRSHKPVDTKQNGSSGHSPLGKFGSISKKPEMQNDFGKGSVAIRNGATKVLMDSVKGGKAALLVDAAIHDKKKSPLKKQPVSAKLKGTSGSPSNGNGNPKIKTELTNMQSFSNTISSASKRMKDRLGMVLSGLGMGHSKAEPVLMMPRDDSVMPSPSGRSQDFVEDARLTRCYSQLSHERFARSATSEHPTTSNEHMSSASYMENLTNKSIDKGHIPCSGVGGSCETTTCQTQALTAGFFSQNNTVANSSIQQTDIPRAKPSGLRMPSPKLGFFDKAKPSSAPQVTTNGLNYSKNMDPKPMSMYGNGPQPGRSASCRVLSESNTLNNNVKQSSLKPPVFSTAKSAHHHSEIGGRMKGSHPSSGIPSAVASRIPSTLHLASTNGLSLLTNRVSSLRSQQDQQESPASLMTHNISMKNGPAAMVNNLSFQYKAGDKCIVKAEENCISKAVEKCVNKDEDHIQSEEKCIKAEEMTAKTEEKHVKSELKCIKAEDKPTKVEEKCTIKPEVKCVKPEGKSTKTEEKALTNLGNVLQTKKNVLNVPTVVRKGITTLTLPSQTLISNGQENAPTTTNTKSQEQELSKIHMEFHPYEIDTEVWPEVKSGAVQHSPTNKEPPKHGPWSPVKRNGQELGPFDCTKYTNYGIAPC